MPRALVTGGTGFLGLHLARALTTAGYDVCTLDVHEPGPSADPDWEFVKADVRDADAMDKATNSATGRHVSCCSTCSQSRRRRRREPILTGP